MKNIFVIIPVHNRVNLTRNCLVCLQNQTYKDFETIVIDDGSIDGTSEMVKNEFPWVMLLKGNGDLWWSRCVNLGIECALNHGAESILTLNDDMELDEDYMETLVHEANRFPNALIGSAAYDITNRDRLIYIG